ncbi:MAG: hypothetical protein AAB360_03645 [Patescibacteria group bacterium]
MTHQDLFRIIQSVQKNIRCPQCGKAYTPSRIQIRGVVDSIIFLELTCKLHMPVLATVTYSPKVSKTKQLNRINTDDVLATHNFLVDFQGTFEQVFKKKA